MKKTTNATFGIDKGEVVHVALLQIHGEDGAYLSALLGSLIGVSLVHFFLIVQCAIPVFAYIFRTLQAMDNRCGLPGDANLSIEMHVSSVQPTFSCESRYVESCKEAIVNSFLCLSSAVEHFEVAPSS